MNVLTLRFALPAVVLVALVTLVALAILFVTHAHILGTAGGWPS